MPAWSNELPPVSDTPGFSLRRTPTDGLLRAIVTSPDIAVCLTHFWGGRTVPCESPDCDACRAMSPRRAHVYVAALDAATRDHFLFECTAAAAEPFRDWIRANNTLRGCLFQAARPKRRRNAKVEIQTKPCDLTKIILPPAPDIALAMSVIWRLPGTAVSKTTGQVLENPITANSNTIDRMRFNPADCLPSAPKRGNNGSRP